MVQAAEVFVGLRVAVGCSDYNTLPALVASFLVQLRIELVQACRCYVLAGAV